MNELREELIQYNLEYYEDRLKHVRRECKSDINMIQQSMLQETLLDLTKSSQIAISPEIG